MTQAFKELRHLLPGHCNRRGQCKNSKLLKTYSKLVHNIIGLVSLVISSCIPFVAASALAQEVRFGTHPDFTRFVVEWPGPVNLSISQNPNELTLQSVSWDNININELQSKLTPYVQNIQINAYGSLSLQLKDKIQVKSGHIEKRIYYFDFTTTRQEPVFSIARNQGVYLISFKSPELHGIVLSDEGQAIRLSLKGELKASLAEELEKYPGLAARVRQENAHFTIAKPGLVVLQNRSDIIQLSLEPVYETNKLQSESVDTEPKFRRMDKTKVEGEQVNHPGGHTGVNPGDLKQDIHNDHPAGHHDSDNEPAKSAAETSPRPEPSAEPEINLQNGYHQRTAIETISTDTLIIKGERGADYADLLFELPQDTPINVFRRTGFLWISFAVKADGIDVDKQSLVPVIAGRVEGLRQENHADFTILRLKLLQKDLPVDVRHDGTYWRVSLNAKRQNGRDPDFAQLGVSQFLMPGVVSGGLVRDPVVGDSLHLAFVRDATRNLTRKTEFVDLMFLPSYAGYVWKNKAGDVSDWYGERGMVLSRGQPLRINPASRYFSNNPPGIDEGSKSGKGESSMAGEQALEEPQEDSPIGVVEAEYDHDEVSGGQEPDQQASKGDPVKKASRPVGAATDSSQDRGSFLNFFESSINQDAVYSTANYKLQNLGGSAEDQWYKNQIFLDLARLNLRHDLAIEARAWLDILKDQSLEEREQLEALAALEGASAFLLGEQKRSEEIFQRDDLELAYGKDIALWRFLNSAKRGYNANMYEEFNTVKLTLFEYPLDLKYRLALDLGHQALALGFANIVSDITDELRKQRLSRDQRAGLLYLEGLLNGADGSVDDAISLLSEARGIARIPMIYEIDIELSKLKVESGEIDLASFSEKMEAWKILWRGLEDENRYLSVLGDYYLRQGKVVEGLDSLKDALERSAHETQREFYLGEMRKTVMAVLSEKRGWLRSPLQALAILREFRSLLPDNEEGNAIIIEIAEELHNQGLVDIPLALLDSIPLDSQNPDRAKLMERLRWRELLEGNTSAPAVARVLQARLEQDKEELPRHVSDAILSAALDERIESNQAAILASLQTDKISSQQLSIFEQELSAVKFEPETGKNDRRNQLINHFLTIEPQNLSAKTDYETEKLPLGEEIDRFIGFSDDIIFRANDLPELRTSALP